MFVLRAEIAMLRRAHRLLGIEVVNATLLRRTIWTREILEAFGAAIGAPPSVIPGPLVMHNADSRGYFNLHIGGGCHVGRMVTLDLSAPLRIDSQATISMGCTLLTHTSTGGRSEAVRDVLSPLRIETGAYLGANVTVLPGCHIGERAVIGAGAVVTRPVTAGARMAGVPAREL